MRETSLELSAEDGHRLNATLLDGGEKGGVLIAPAMATPIRFYKKFALYLADNGFKVLLMDYRGVASNDRGQDASLEDWITKDLKLAIDYLNGLSPKVYYVGHSIGGQVIGIIPNFDKITAVAFVSVSVGTWWKNKKFNMTLGAWFFIKVFIPFSNKIFNRSKSALVGMGVDVPKGASSDWAKWCSSNNYLGDFKDDYESYRCDVYDLPTLNITISDDTIATPKAIAELKALYPKAKFEDVTIKGKGIGHLGFFSSKNSELWGQILEWFRAY